jgi:DNA-directed RNA polymerase subunit RPC12/RpoP
VGLITKYAFRGNCTTEVNDDNVKIEGPCYSCSKPIAVTVKVADYKRFEGGEFAQDCFSYLSADQREFLISGICGECWDKMFPKEDEDAD